MFCITHICTAQLLLTAQELQWGVNYKDGLGGVGGLGAQELQWLPPSQVPRPTWGTRLGSGSLQSKKIP